MYNCRNSAVIVNLANGQIPRSTERFSSLLMIIFHLLTYLLIYFI